MSPFQKYWRDNSSSPHTPERLICRRFWDDALTSQWTLVSEGLPKVDEFIIWQNENGVISYWQINKDMDDKLIQKLLKGTEYTGPVIRWMRVPK